MNQNLDVVYMNIAAQQEERMAEAARERLANELVSSSIERHLRARLADGLRGLASAIQPLPRRAPSVTRA